MSAPVINFEQSIPAMRTWNPAEVQHSATNDPTLWTCTRLLTGLIFDTLTATISGTPTVAGECSYILRAYNADGWSAPVTFFLAVADAGPPPTPGFISTRVEMTTGLLTFNGGAAVQMAKSGDDFLQEVQFTRNGTPLDFNIEAMHFSLKLIESDEVLVTGTSYDRIGTGTGTVFRHATSLAGDALADALEIGVQRMKLHDVAGSAELDKRVARVMCLAEVEIVFANATGIGPEHSRWTSQTALLEVVRELTANP